jgi:hypothetical protein
MSIRSELFEVDITATFSGAARSPDTPNIRPVLSILFGSLSVVMKSEQSISSSNWKQSSQFFFWRRRRRNKRDEGNARHINLFPPDTKPLQDTARLQTKTREENVNFKYVTCRFGAFVWSSRSFTVDTNVLLTAPINGRQGPTTLEQSSNFVKYTLWSYIFKWE